MCRRFPQILEAVAAGHLHLTGASLIAAHLTAENVESLIAAAAGKTRREVEKIIAALGPKAAFEPSLRKLPSRTPSETARVEERSAVVTPKRATSEGDLPVLSAGQRTRDLLEPATEDRSNFRFSAGSEFAEKFKRFAEVLGIDCPQNHLEEILDQALEIALEKKDPQRKLERRREREAKKGSPRPGDAEQGKKSHDEQHLRAFCPAHNLQAARKFYGEDFIERKIEAARRERVVPTPCGAS